VAKILIADDEASLRDALGIILAGASTGEKAAIPCLDDLVGCGLPVLGMGDAANQLREGASDFQKGNMRLSLALTLVKEHMKEA